MLRRDLWRAAATLAASGARLGGADASYQAAIAAWRKEYDHDLRSEKGPLLLIGRQNLPEGRSEVGSNVSSHIQLPDRAPKRAGVVERRGDMVTFEPAAEIVVKLNAKQMSGPAVLRTGLGSQPRDAIEFGDFKISVAGLDGNFQVAISDTQSSYRTMFQGALWFPVNANYRVEAVFTPYPQPKEVRIPDTTGRVRISKAPGYVTFQLNGEPRRLEPTASGDKLFFMFKDLTAGRETYGAGRYLDAEMPKDGKVVLDFNKAYNPYCAINPYSSCPIPPKENRLVTRVEAGEKYRGDH